MGKRSTFTGNCSRPQSSWPNAFGAVAAQYVIAGVAQEMAYLVVDRKEKRDRSWQIPTVSFKTTRSRV